MLPAPVKWVSVPGLGSAGRRSRRRCPAACGDRDVSVGGSPSSRLREAPLGEAATTWDHNGTRLRGPWPLAPPTAGSSPGAPPAWARAQTFPCLLATSVSLGRSFKIRTRSQQTQLCHLPRCHTVTQESWAGGTGTLVCHQMPDGGWKLPSRLGSKATAIFGWPLTDIIIIAGK